MILPVPNIAIVEDELDQARIYQDILSDLGFNVLSPLTRGEDVEDLVKRTKVDLAVMDIRLAGTWNGIETARFLRDKHGIPCIYVTAHVRARDGDPDLMRQARETSPLCILDKPTTEARLEEAVRDGIWTIRNNLRIELIKRKIQQNNLTEDEETLLAYLQAEASRVLKTVAPLNFSIPGP